jgi:hypothetical protein
LQQPALFALDQPLLLAGFEVGVRDFARLLLRAGRRRQCRTFRTIPHQPPQRRRQRAEEPDAELEGRQQYFEHTLRILTDDEQRQHVLEEQDEYRHEQQQHPDRPEPGGARHHRNDNRREREDQAEKQTRGQKELNWIVEIEAQTIVAPASLRHEAQRQPHERAERRLDGADVDRRDGEQQKKGGHQR